MNNLQYRDDNWMHVGFTAVVAGQCIAGKASGQWMLVSFWLADRLAGCVRLANDNLNRT